MGTSQVKAIKAAIALLKDVEHNRPLAVGFWLTTRGLEWADVTAFRIRLENLLSKSE